MRPPSTLHVLKNPGFPYLSCLLAYKLALYLEVSKNGRSRRESLRGPFVRLRLSKPPEAKSNTRSPAIMAKGPPSIGTHIDGYGKMPRGSLTTLARLAAISLTRPSLPQSPLTNGKDCSGHLLLPMGPHLGQMERWQGGCFHLVYLAPSGCG